jgi:hypothetical protein
MLQERKVEITSEQGAGDRKKGKPTGRRSWSFCLQWEAGGEEFLQAEDLTTHPWWFSALDRNQGVAAVPLSAPVAGASSAQNLDFGSNTTTDPRLAVARGTLQSWEPPTSMPTDRLCRQLLPPYTLWPSLVQHAQRWRGWRCAGCGGLNVVNALMHRVCKHCKVCSSARSPSRRVPKVTHILGGRWATVPAVHALSPWRPI